MKKRTVDLTKLGKVQRQLYFNPREDHSSLNTIHHATIFVKLPAII